MKSAVNRAAATLALGLLLAGCGHAQAPAPAAGAGPEQEARLLAQMRQAIGDASCSSDAECRTVPVGAKACGGPAAWWAWSQTRTDAAQLQAWSMQLDRLQRKRFEATGQQSNCQVVPDPGAACVAQRCVLRTRSGLI
jgi:hypothetical protein